MPDLQHAPGPWVRRGLSVFRDGETALSIAVATQHQKSACANAQLIAAAPELFHALDDLLSCIDGPHDAQWLARCKDQAAAALAKATAP